MAIEERKTKAERRAEARAERKRREEEERKQTQRRQFSGIVGALVLLVFVGGGVYFMLDNGDSAEAAERTISATAAADAREAAACEVLAEDAPLPDATHFSPETAPPADQLYGTSLRPNHSGSHYEGVHPPLAGAPSSPIEERAVTHNLEHGSVVVWFDPDQVDGDTVSDMESWMNARQSMGFEGRGGGNVFVSPASNITSGKAVALRAWGQAWDCDGWDETVADSFLIEYWGTHGIAPERPLSPYPEEALGYSDATVGDNTEAPTGDRHTSESPETSSETAPAEDDATPTDGQSGS